jgi:hypothetical protein
MMASLKTVLAICNGDSDAPISPKVERIRSNLMAQIEAAG